MHQTTDTGQLIVSFPSQFCSWKMLCHLWCTGIFKGVCEFKSKEKFSNVKRAFWSNLRVPLALGYTCCHDADFIITGVTTGYRYDNLQGHQWWQSCHYDNFQFSLVEWALSGIGCSPVQWQTLKQRWLIISLIFKSKLQWNLDQNTNIFFKVNAFWICYPQSVQHFFFKPPCVKYINQLIYLWCPQHQCQHMGTTFHQQTHHVIKT